MDQKERIGRKTNKECFIHEYYSMVIDFSVEMYGWNFFSEECIAVTLTNSSLAL